MWLSDIKYLSLFQEDSICNKFQVGDTEYDSDILLIRTIRNALPIVSYDFNASYNG